MTYFWFDPHGWWWGDPEGSWGFGPFDSYDVMIRHRGEWLSSDVSPEVERRGRRFGEPRTMYDWRGPGLVHGPAAL
jgi:hypothetical protein